MNETTLREESEPGFSGALLRERREARGISMDEAVERTRIRRLFLEAMEEERFGDLPGDAYVTGFLRSYAGFLGLDADEVVQCYQRRFKKQAFRKPEEPAVDQGPLHPVLQRRFLVPAGLVAAAAILFFLARLLLFSPDSDQASTPTFAAVSDRGQPVVAPAGEPAVEQPALPGPVPNEPAAADAIAGALEEPGQPEGVSAVEPLAGIPSQGAVLRIKALAAGWLEVTIDDRMVQRYQLQPGTVLSWKIERVLHLETELPHQVKMWLNESPFDLADRTALHLGPIS